MSDINDMIKIPELAIVLKDDAALATWSEARVNEFVETYKKRVLAARIVLHEVATKVFSTAVRRSFVSQNAEIKGLCRPSDTLHGYHCAAEHDCRTKTGRDLDDLLEVAEQRAKEILAGLPTLKTVSKILSPETTKQLNRIDTLSKDLTKLKKELSEMVQTFHMSDYPDMRCKDFVTMVKANEEAREKCVKTIVEKLKEKKRVQAKVDQYFYKGVPGLSEEVLKTCEELISQAQVLDESVRRVEESLKFGDSQLAAELLSQFDTNERAVSGDTALRFKKALEKLKKSRAAKK